MDSVGNIGSRRRVAGNLYTAEEQALDIIAKEVSIHVRLPRSSIIQIFFVVVCY